ncbi:hypothetical protein CRUP_005965 [Coryphaenoides rupestris]|nr:hypothetical protein CRUP_005965 [Coryphaenoides rupestris]
MSSLVKQEESVSLQRSSAVAAWTTTLGRTSPRGGGSGGWPKKRTLTSSKPSFHRRRPAWISCSTALWKSRTVSQGKLPTWSNTSKQSRCLIFLSSGASSCSRMRKYPSMKRSRVKLSWVAMAIPSDGRRNCSGEYVTLQVAEAAAFPGHSDFFQWLRNSTTMRSFLKLTVSMTAVLWRWLKADAAIPTCGILHPVDAGGRWTRGLASEAKTSRTPCSSVTPSPIIPPRKPLRSLPLPPPVRLDRSSDMFLTISRHTAAPGGQRWTSSQVHVLQQRLLVQRDVEERIRYTRSSSDNSSPKGPKMASWVWEYFQPLHRRTCSCLTITCLFHSAMGRPSSSWVGTRASMSARTTSPMGSPLRHTSSSQSLYAGAEQHLSEGLRQPVLKRFLMEREAGSLASRE